MALLLNTVTTLMMCGIAWYLQVVHYPLLAQVGPDNIPAYSEAHVNRATRILAPLMLLEAAAAVWLCIVTKGASRPLVFIGAAYLLPIWIATSLVQGPCHNALKIKWDEKIWKRLVLTNWIRTVAWSVRALIAMLLVWVAARL